MDNFNTPGNNIVLPPCERTRTFRDSVLERQTDKTLSTQFNWKSLHDVSNTNVTAPTSLEEELARFSSALNKNRSLPDLLHCTEEEEFVFNVNIKRSLFTYNVPVKTQLLLHINQKKQNNNSGRCFNNNCENKCKSRCNKTVSLVFANPVNKLSTVTKTSEPTTIFLKRFPYQNTVKKSREIKLDKLVYNNPKFDLTTQGLKILFSFIQQLISDKVNVKKQSFEETMYRKSLQKQGLGIERHSSMPEMTRDEYLEQKEKSKLRRNASFGSTDQLKKRVLKTKVSSRLLQPTKSSTKKQKDRIDYVPPAKKSDLVWTDRPLRNVDSGYTEQTYVKYLDEPPERNYIESCNEVNDKKELIKWGNASPSTSRKANLYHRDIVSDSESTYKPTERKSLTYSSDIETSSSKQPSPYKQRGPYHQPYDIDSNSDNLDNKTPFASILNQENKTKTEQIPNLSQFSYEPFTAFSKSNQQPFVRNACDQTTVFSTATSTVHDSKVFKFVYTIDAELSYREYNKLMNIIAMLQEQKRRWEEEVQEVRDKLEKTGKEKMQLAHNNHILRQSLEAANRAIKEINGKVQELKQSLVPLRDENSKLRDELTRKSDKISSLKNDKIDALNDTHEQKKIKLIHEEQIKIKETEMEEYKQCMHEKFRKLEEAYRTYRSDVEKSNAHKCESIDDLQRNYDKLLLDNKTMEKEQEKVRNEANSFMQINVALETRVKALQTEVRLVELKGTQEFNKYYSEEIENMREELKQSKLDTNKYKDETNQLETENDHLKNDLENMENKFKNTSSNKLQMENLVDMEKQRNQMLQIQLDDLQKQCNNYHELKQTNENLSNEKDTYLSRLEDLNIQVTVLKDDQTTARHVKEENTNLKDELNQLTSEIKAVEAEKDFEKTEKERFKDEILQLQEQINAFKSLDSENNREKILNENFQRQINELKSNMGQLNIEKQQEMAVKEELEIQLCEYKRELQEKPTDDETKELRNEITQLHININNASKLASEVTSQKEQLKREFDELDTKRKLDQQLNSNENESLKKQVNRLTNEINEIDKEKRKETTEKQRIEIELDLLKRELELKPSNDETEKWKDEMAKLRTDIFEANRLTIEESTQKERVKNELEESKAKFHTTQNIIEKENENLRRQINALQDNVDKIDKAKREEVIAKKQFQLELDQLKREMNFKPTDNEIEQWKNEITRLKVDMSEMNKLKYEETTNKEQLKNELRELQMNLKLNKQLSENEAESFKNQISQLKSDISEIDKQKYKEIAHKERLQTDIKLLKNELNLKPRDENADQWKNEVARLQAEINGIIQSEKKEKERLSIKLSATENELSSVSKLRENDNKNFRDEMNMLKQQLAEIDREKKFRVTENERLRVELDYLRQQLNLLQEKIMSPQNTSQQVDKNNNNDNIRVELEKLRLQMKELSDQNHRSRKTREDSQRNRTVNNTLVMTKNTTEVNNVFSKNQNNNYYNYPNNSNFDPDNDINQQNHEVHEVKPESLAIEENMIDDRVIAEVELQACTEPLILAENIPQVNQANVKAPTDEEVASKTSTAKDEERARVREEERKRKLKEIENKIKRKREQTGSWSLKTPSIESMQRLSNEGISTYDIIKGDNTSSRRRSRSNSGPRSQSADPKKFEPVGRPLKHKGHRTERGRSPQRRNITTQSSENVINSMKHYKSAGLADRFTDGSVNVVDDQRRGVRTLPNRSRHTNNNESSPASTANTNSQNVYNTQHREIHVVTHEKNARERRKKSEERRKERMKNKGVGESSNESNEDIRDKRQRRKTAAKGQAKDNNISYSSDPNERSDFLSQAMKSRQESSSKKPGLRHMKFKDDSEMYDPVALSLIKKRDAQQRSYESDEQNRQYTRSHQYGEHQTTKQQTFNQNSQSVNHKQQKQQERNQSQQEQQPREKIQMQQEEERKKETLRQKRFQKQETDANDLLKQRDPRNQFQQYIVDQKSSQQNYEQASSKQTAHTRQVQTVKTHTIIQKSSQTQQRTSNERNHSGESLQRREGSEQPRNTKVKINGNSSFNGESSLEKKTFKSTNGNEGVKIPLTPTTQRRMKDGEETYATVNKSQQIKTKEERKLNENEIDEMRRMEEARQKVLLQKQMKNGSKSSANAEDTSSATKSQSTYQEVITVDGIPVKREPKDNRVNIMNDGKSENSRFYGNEIISSSNTFESSQNKSSYGTKNEGIQKSNTNEMYGHQNHSSYGTIDRNGKARSNQFVSSNEEENFRSLPRNMKPLQQSITNQISQSQKHHHSNELLTKENVDIHQTRSYRDTKLHENMLRRNKKIAANKDSSVRSSVMSNDSLGGFSQVTFATVSDDNIQKYDDYATQLDGPTQQQQQQQQKQQQQQQQQQKQQHDHHQQQHQQQFHGYTNTSSSNFNNHNNTMNQTFDETEILKYARNMPKGHSKFNCEKCRELNSQRKGGQPLTFCWERYYPISQTTPQPSMQSLIPDT